MLILEETVILTRPVHEVFAFVADQTNAPAWQKGLLRVHKTTEGPLGVGTRHSFERKILGRRTIASNIYTEYVPDESVHFRSTSGPLQFQASYQTTKQASGTRLTSRLELEGGRGPSRFALPLIARSIRREMQNNFATLKKMLEDPSRSQVP